MDPETIKKLSEFGIALVEREHRFFVEEGIDNSEHVKAIKRLADTAHKYLQANGVRPEVSKEVRKQLIDRGRKLFVEEWMKQLHEDGDPFGEQDAKDARRTFDDLLKGNNK